MHIPDLLDLVEREEHDITQREQDAKCIPQWNRILRWLEEFPNDVPVFKDYVDSQIKHIAANSAQCDRMHEMLDAAYPSTTLSRAYGADTTYGYSRLLHTVHYFVLGKEPLESA